MWGTHAVIQSQTTFALQHVQHSNIYIYMNHVTALIIRMSVNKIPQFVLPASHINKLH